MTSKYIMGNSKGRQEESSRDTSKAKVAQGNNRAAFQVCGLGNHLRSTLNCSNL